MKVNEEGLLRLTAVSPVCIGNGVKLGGIDYVVEGNEIVVKDVKRYLADPSILFEAKTAAVENDDPSAIPQSFDLYSLKSHLAADRPKTLEQLKELLRESAKSTKEITAFIKDVESRPYVPASSVKGAIRSAIAWALISKDAVLQSLPQASTQKRQWASQKLLERFFGKGATLDFMKVFLLRDSKPFDINQLGVFVCRVLNSSRDIEFCVEALEPDNSNIELPFFIDSYRSRSQGDYTLKSGLDYLKDKEKLKEAVSTFSSAIIHTEKNFFSNSRGMEPMADFYSSLAERSNAEIFLPVGFSTGWNHKTIGLKVDGKDLEEFRKKQALGKVRHRGCSGNVNWQDKKSFFLCRKCKKKVEDRDIILSHPFPKTRKVIYIDAKPTYPLGWMKMEVM